MDFPTMEGRNDEILLLLEGANEFLSSVELVSHLESISNFNLKKKIISGIQVNQNLEHFYLIPTHSITMINGAGAKNTFLFGGGGSS